MPDMDLREVLADRLAGVTTRRSLNSDQTVDLLLARLRESDVLDEFERRCTEAMRTIETESFQATARRVLSDMLGGGS